MPQFANDSVMVTGFDVAGEVWQAMLAALEVKE